MTQLTASGFALFNSLEAGAAPLRPALRALASEPDFFRAPHQAIARLRPRIYAEHRRLAQVTKIHGSLDERLRSWTRLADGAIIGLSHLARLSVDVEARSAVAPFAVTAVGEYGARRCGPESILELQYLLPEDQRSWERSGRIVAFIRIGLAELGIQHHRDAVGTAVECACVARGDPTAAARFATARFLSGQYGLYAGFAGILGGARRWHVLSTPTRPARTYAAPARPAFEDRADLDVTKSSASI
jgi:UTP:GlnB (protein PII) uridylyltransferase